MAGCGSCLLQVGSDTFTESFLRLKDLTAKDYVESDPLDLDHLSTREGGTSEEC